MILHDHMIAWMHGCMDAWMHGCMDAVEFVILDIVICDLFVICNFYL
jgi:hypothetical protein